MNCWEFTLILRDVAEMTDSLANALYEAATLQDAIQSAVRDVRQAGCEIARVEIECEELHAWPA